ncbi:MAG: hypothetical protein PHU85_07985 [Phycisphaerae bacterium]|nr:hypothetical protein [Phycisphaerae bacterium]
MSWSDRVVSEMKRDWKRTGFLAVLLVVGVVLAIKQFGGSPAPANAKPAAGKAGAGGSAAAPAAPGAVAPGDARDGGGVTVVGGAKAKPAADGKVFRFASDVSTMTLPRRDPFRVDLTLFPPDPSAVESKLNGDVKSTGPLGDTDTEVARRQALEAVVKAEAAKLHVQSILMVDPPQAMIGRDVYRVGSKIGPFTLTKITSNSVTLEKEGFEVVLRME